DLAGHVLPRMGYEPTSAIPSHRSRAWRPAGGGAGRSGPPRAGGRRLLQLDDGALLLEALLDLLGLRLGGALLHRLGRAVHEVLGLLEAQARDLPDDLDDLDLLGAALLEDDRELGLLLGGRRGRPARGPARGGGGDGDVELGLER